MVQIEGFGVSQFSGLFSPAFSRKRQPILDTKARK
jgi:hypothetical protein